MNKVDYKKDFKELYLPPKSPTIVTIPPMNFIMIDGEGDPNKEPFPQVVTALYGVSYAIKMSYKSKNVPDNYYDYTVFPLEGVWDLVDNTLLPTDKNNLKYTIMMRQPDFLTVDLLNRFIDETKMKKPNEFLDKIRFGTIEEGLCCQMLHIGSYDDEPASFKLMEEFCARNGYVRTSLVHREIYLSDPRRVDKDKMKTVLRFKIKK